MKKRPNLVFWLIGAVLLALLLGSLAWNHEPEGNNAPRAGFDDATPTGGKGFRLLLQRLDYTPKLVVAPLSKVPQDARVWCILDPQTQFSRREANDLTAWVQRGGTLIWCLDAGKADVADAFHSLGLNTGFQALHRNFGLSERDGFGASLQGRPPAQPVLAPIKLDAPTIYRTGVGSASGGKGEVNSWRAHLEIASGDPNIVEIPFGKGRALVFPDAWLFTNYALAQADNAALVSNFVRVNAPAGAVYFDERAHSDDLAPPTLDSLWNRLKKPPYVWAIWQLFFAALLLALFKGRRLGQPMPLPTSGPVTRASQYARAMGALFQKAEKPQSAARIIGEDFRRRVAKRVGLSPHDSDELLAGRAAELCNVPLETFDALLLASRAPSELDSRLLREAAQMEHVLRELES